jgi:hypothetical protein
MSLPYDLRTAREPLDARTTRKRRLLELLTQEVVASMSEGTASNYNTAQYGSNHRIFYEGIGSILAALIIEVIELSDDRSFREIRSDFLGRKVLDYIYSDENLPLVEGDEALKSLAQSTLAALLKGSTETSIVELISALNLGAEVFFTQSLEHIVSLTVQSFGFTGISQGHRHFVLDSRVRGLSSTTAPIGWSWGDALHQHEIRDGVVQTAEGHTHTLDYNLPLDVITLQQNILKLLRTTKPAHIKIGNISNLISEEISSPQDTSVTFSREGLGDYSESESDGFSLVYTLGASFQENLRKPRLGTYERLVFGYASGRKIRLRSALLSLRDAIKTNTTRRITALLEISPTNGTYVFSFPRIGLSETYSVSDGLFSISPSEIKAFGDGELVTLTQGGINKGAYFVEILSQTYCRVRALEVTLDAISTESGLIDCEFIDYPWGVRPLKYRDVVAVVISTTATTATFKLNAPLQKIYKGLPLTKDYIYSNDELEISSFDSISNQLVVESLSLSIGDTSVFRAPFGEGDLFNFTELNNPSFVLNNHRNYAHHSNLSGRGVPSQPNLRTLALGDKPAVGLYPVSPIRPFTTDEAQLTTPIGNTSTLNNQGFTLGGGKLKLNQLPPLSPTSVGNIKSYAVGVAFVREGKIPFHALGFIPSQIISVIDVSTDDPLSYTTSENILFLPEAVDGTQVSVTAISTQPLGKITSWAKSESLLSEHQVPFVNTAPASTLPSPEEVMSNPQGRKIIQSDLDEPRNNLIKRTLSTEGQRGEEIFYEDDFLNLSISASPFISELEVFARTRTPYLPSLVLNDTTSHLGSSTALAFSLNVLEETLTILFIGEGAESLSDTIPSISDEVSFEIGVGASDSLPSISDDVSTTLLLVSLSLSDTLSLSDSLSTSLLLFPSEITETNPLISDEVSTALSVSLSSTDTLPLTLDDISLNYSFSPLSLSDTLTPLSDQIQTFYSLQEITPSDTLSLISDEIGVSFDQALSLTDTLPLTLDDISLNYSFSAPSLTDTLPLTLDDVLTTLTLEEITPSDTLSLISDSVSLMLEREIVLSDSLPSTLDEIETALDETLGLSDSVSLPSDEVSVFIEQVVNLSENVSSPSDEVAVFIERSIAQGDLLSAILDAVEVSLSVEGALLSDTLPTISDTITASLSLTALSTTDNIDGVTDEVSAIRRNSASLSDTLTNISDVATSDLFISPSGVSDTLGAMLDEVQYTLSLLSVAETDTLTSLVDEVSVSYAYLAVSVSDVLSVAVDNLGSELGAVVADGIGGLTDDVSYLVAWGVSLTDSVGLSGDSATPLLEQSLTLSDTLSVISDAVGYLRNDFASISDSIGGVTDTLSYFSEVSLDLSDSMPSTTDEASGDYNPPANFTLYAALTANSKTITDAERFIVYTADDYFARRGSLTQTLFSSIPTATVYQDSASVTFLTTSDTRRGFIKPLIQTPAYANTTPPSANISWAVQGGSTTDGEFMPNIDYSIISRSLVDDPASDVSIAFKSDADGSNTFSVMGASPTYNQLYPSTTSGTIYYKHTLRVDEDGVITFTQDTTPKVPVFSSSSRIYFYVQNIDGGLGAGASPASSIRVLNGAGTSFISPTIHVAGEVSSVSGTATFTKSNITNPNNISQVSWGVSPLTNYQIILNRDAAVDMKIFMRVRSGSGSTEYNTLYSSSDVLPYKSFDSTRLGVSFYLQIIEDGTVLITN